MAKAKKPADTAAAAATEEKTYLQALKDELAHWELYLKNQGIDDSEPHLYTERVQAVRDKIAELE